MPTIRCKAQLFKVNSWLLLRLPKNASAKLPSRGLVLAEGTINGHHFQAPLEPDGKGSHWFRVGKSMQESAGADEGDTVSLTIEPSKEWPEPKVPEDLKKALKKNPHAQEVWLDTTTKARWDWIRWIRATKNPETRKKRIQVTCSKLKAGERRPCCFNRSMCTEPAVSKNGVLLKA